MFSVHLDSAKVGTRTTYLEIAIATMYRNNLKSILLVPIILASLPIHLLALEKCGSEGFVFGQNDIVDQLLSCSTGRIFDLDLTPHGDHVKNTPKTLIEQGLSNKTTVLFAKLGGLWTAKRANFVETAWLCEENKTIINAVIEFNGLNLEVVEKFDVPLHRSQHKLSLHKPCKTFDLPISFCRQSKPIYKTTRTWANRAFFNLTLSQTIGASKPTVEGLSFLFTCPDTFRQKITHSPSATYVISKLVYGLQESSLGRKKRELPDSDNKIPVAHPGSFSMTQDGRSPASPPYHTSVNLILNQVTAAVRSSFEICINSVDCDLSLLQESVSFGTSRFVDHEDSQFFDKSGTRSECSSKRWLKNKLQIADANSINTSGDNDMMQNSHDKRSQSMLNYPTDPNQLLNPHGYYHDNIDHGMIDDE